MADNKMVNLISREYLLESIKKFTKRSDAIICEDFEVKRATSGVEGFLSLVFRVNVQYHFHDDEKVHRKSLIVKRFPQTEMLVEFSQRSGIFVREGTYFDKVVPMMKKLSGGKVNIPLPECYHVVYGSEDDVIVLEDLKEGGYSTPNPSYLSEGFDLGHCRVVMRQLGCLHGLAVAAERSLEPDAGGWLKVFPAFSREVCFYESQPGIPPSPLTGMTQNAIQTILMLCKNMDSLPKEAEASGKLAKALEGLWPVLCRLVRPKPESPNIPCHGDCWMNNLMFRYDTGEDAGSSSDDASKPDRAVDVKFIDLQVTRYCHPAVDILYFLYLSTRRSLRESHLDELLAEYHSSISKTLEAINGGPPLFSLEQLRRDVAVEYKPFGVIIGAVMTPFFMLGQDLVQSEPGDVTPENIDDMLRTGNSDAVRARYNQDPLFKSRMDEMILELVEMAFPRGLNSLESSPLMQC